MSDLLEQFITLECTAHERRLLEDAIADLAKRRPHFEYNCFEITIERDMGIVVLQDVLDGSEDGVQRVPVAEFLAALRRSAKPNSSQ